MQVRDQLATMDAQQLRDFAAELIEKGKRPVSTVFRWEGG
jgi:hypothetical protein